MAKELLPPPPKKKTVEDNLLPPPPKKKSLGKLESSGLPLPSSGGNTFTDKFETAFDQNTTPSVTPTPQAPALPQKNEQGLTPAQQILQSSNELFGNKQEVQDVTALKPTFNQDTEFQAVKNKEGQQVVKRVPVANQQKSTVQPDKQKYVGTAAEKDSKMNWSEADELVQQEVMKQFIAPIFKSIGILSREVQTSLPVNLYNYYFNDKKLSSTKIDDYAAYQFGKALDWYADFTYPVSDETKQSTAGQTISGVTSLGGYMALGALGVATGAGTVALPAIFGALQNGSQEYDRALETVRDAQTLDDQSYYEKYGQGSDYQTIITHKNELAQQDAEKVAFDTSLGAAAIGSAEGLPVFAWMKRVDNSTGGLFGKAFQKYLAGESIGTVGTTALKQGAEEALQESATQLFTNMNAIQIYDKTREIMEGVAESGTMGFLLGGTVGGLTRAIQSRLQDPSLSAGDKAILNKSLAELEQKKEAFKDIKDDEVVKAQDDIPVVQELKKQKVELEMDLADRETNPTLKDQISEKIDAIDTQIEESKVSAQQEAVSQAERVGEIANVEEMISNLEAQKEQSTPATQELLQPQIDEAIANLEALKSQSNDTEPIQTNINQGGSNQETPTSGNVQENEQEIEKLASNEDWTKLDHFVAENAISVKEAELYAKPMAKVLKLIEEDLDAQGYEISKEYDDGIIKDKATGELIDIEDLPKDLQKKVEFYGNTIDKFEKYKSDFVDDIRKAKTTEPINKITNEKPTITPTEIATGSNPKGIRQDATENAVDTRPIKKITKQGRKPRNQRKPGKLGQEALALHPNSARDLVMQYFIGGGRIRRSVLENQYGKNANKEFSTRINLLDKGSKNTSLDGTADEIMNVMGDERFSSSEIVKALEEVLNDHHHPNGMAKEMVEKYGDGKSEADIESDIKEAEYHRRIYEESLTKNDETDGTDVDNTIGFLETMSDEEIQAYAEGKDKAFDESKEKEADDWMTRDIEDDGSTPWDDMKTTLDKVVSALEKGKIDTKGNLNAFGIVPAIWNAAIDTLILAVKAAKATGDVVKAVDNFIKELKDKGATFDEKEVRASIEKSVGLKPKESVKEEVKTETKTEKKEEPAKPKEKELKVAKRVEVSDNPDVSDDIKKGLKDLGTTYIPENMKVNEADADAYVSTFVENNELDKAIDNVMDLNNGMTGLARGIIGAKLFDVLSKKAREATTLTEKQKLDTQAAKVAKFAAVQLKAAGQEINAGKVWKKLLQNNPEAAVQQLTDEYAERNESIIQRDIKDIRGAKKDLEEFLKSEEGQDVIREEVEKEIEKRSENLFGKEQKKKISDFFDSLLINTKGKLFDATFALPVAVYNGAIKAMKQATLLGADAANAIKAGVDYVAKNHSGAWKQKDFELTMEKGLKTLKPKKKTTLSKSSTDKILNAWEKRLGKLNDEQRKKLLANSIDELNNLGALSEDRFKELYAEAMGLPVMTEEKKSEIFQLIDDINSAEKAGDDLKKVYDDDASTRSDIDKALKVWQNSLRKARNSNERLSAFFRKDKNIWETLTTLMQGNLLTPMSLITNIYSNMALRPLAIMSGGVSSAMDYMVSKAAQYTGLSKVASPERSFNYLARFKGSLKGLAPGLREGIQDFKYGLTEEEIKERDLTNKLQPLKAATDLLATLSGKKKAKTMEVLNNFAEATAGIPANVFFKLLNLGDKPFRRMAEIGKAFEIAKLKDLKGKELEKFLLFPDEKSAEEIKAAGDEATFQKDNFSSKQVTQFMNSVKNIRGIGQPLHFLLKGIIPYVKTPTNIIGEALNYALPPVTFSRAVYHAAQGERKQSLELFGKAIVGSMLGVVAYQLLSNGLLTGGDDKEDKPSERSIRYENVPPNSMNISALRRGMAGQGFKPKDDDVWINYQKTGIPGMVLGMYANMGKDKTKEQLDKMNIGEMAALGIPSVLKSSFEQSYLSGTSALMSAVADGGSKLDRFVTSYVNTISSTAYPNTLSNISKASDDFIRSTKDETLQGQITNMFKNKMFMGKDLPSKVTLWGEKVANAPEGRNKYAYSLFDVTKYKNVDTENFGYKLYSAWNESKDAGYLPSLPSQTISIKKQDVKLSPKQYEQYLIFVGKERRKLVEAYVNSPNWEKDSQEERKDKLSRLYSAGRDIGKILLLKADEELYKLTK